MTDEARSSPEGRSAGVALTRSEKQIVLTVAIAIALTRLLALSASLFDWDEALFVLGVRDYDVASHHPHPPGYPLFIAAAKAFAFAGLDEFRALQSVVLLAAVCVFPAVFLLAREIGFGFTTSVGGALVFSFLPNVWIYGGTAFSDVPGSVAGLFACLLLLRGRRDRRSYLAGAVVLGLAVGIRPTNLLLGAVPAVLATWRWVRESRSTVAAAILAGALIGAASYWGAAVASSSIHEYVESVKLQARYVRQIDSWRNPVRGPLAEVASIFMIWPVRQQQQMVGLALLAVVSLVAGAIRWRGAPWLTFAIFAPFAIFAWLNLDFEAAGRYSIAYLPAHALLAADGLGVISRGRRRVQAVLVGCVATVFVVWASPGIQRQRSVPSPPAAALEWARTHSARSTPIYVYSGLLPQASAILRAHPVVLFDARDQVDTLDEKAWVVDLVPVEGGLNFIWPRKELWKVLRRRCFEASVSHPEQRVRFGAGWYGVEGGGAETWRWMGGEGIAHLAGLEGGAQLRIRMHIPLHALPEKPEIEVRLNGILLERFVVDRDYLEKTWKARGRAGENELRIRTSIAAAVPTDSRTLGLRVDRMSWSRLH